MISEETSKYFEENKSKGRLEGSDNHQKTCIREIMR